MYPNRQNENDQYKRTSRGEPLTPRRVRNQIVAIVDEVTYDHVLLWKSVLLRASPRIHVDKVRSKRALSNRGTGKVTNGKKVRQDHAYGNSGVVIVFRRLPSCSISQRRLGGDFPGKGNR